MKVNVKAQLQAAALRKLTSYLDAFPNESRALCESVFIDLISNLTITDIESWCNELDLMIEKNISWSAETEAE